MICLHRFKLLLRFGRKNSGGWSDPEECECPNKDSDDHYCEVPDDDDLPLFTQSDLDDMKSQRDEFRRLSSEWEAAHDYIHEELDTACVHLRASKDEVGELREQLETERTRVVACGVVAMADTPESAAKVREMHPDYMSASCQDVMRRVDECIELRTALDMAIKEVVEWSTKFGKQQYETDQLREELRKGGYICKRCGLRKDSDHPKGDF